MTPRSPSTPPAPRVALPFLLLGALAVRLPALGRPSLWFDELLEVERATGPWRELFFGRPIDQDPTLFALALRGWIAVGRAFGWPWVPGAAGHGAGAGRGVAVVESGWAEVWLRLPSVALGVAAVALTAVWATRWFGRRVGTLSALLLALSPLAIYHSQEVNQYAAMIAAAPLLLLLHERVTSRGARRDWLAYAAVSAAALATHYGLVFPLLALGLDLAWRAWRMRHVRHDADDADDADYADYGETERRFGRAVAAYALWCAAVIAALFALGLGSRMALPHVQPRLWGTHLAKELAYIGDVGWREIVVFFPFPFAGGPAIVVANVLGVLALVGAVRLWRGRGGERGRGRLLVGGYVGGTLAATYLTSVVGWYPLGYRYGVFNVVPYVVLVAAGMEAVPRIGRDALAAAACIALAAFWPHAPWTPFNPFLHVPREDVRPVLREVAAGWRDGDRLLAYDGAAPAVRFYWRGDPAGVVVLPPLRPSDARATSDTRIAAALGTAIDSARGGSGAPDGRVWIVLSHVDPGDEAVLRSALEAMNAAPNAVIRGDGAEAVRVDGRW